MSAIALPDGTRYTFRYNKYGELSEITYPTGGYTMYDWTNINSGSGAVGTVNSFNSRWIWRKRVCRDPGGAASTIAAGGTEQAGTCPVAEDVTIFGHWDGTNYKQPSCPAGQLSYSIYEPTGDRVDVNASGQSFPIGNSPACLFQQLGSTTVTDYTSGSSTPIGSVSTTYTAGGYPSSQTTTIGSKSSVKSWAYDQFVPWDSTYATSMGCNPTCPIDDPIDITEQDFDGTVIRDTKYSYVSAYRDVPRHMYDLPLNAKVYDKNGTLVGETDYAYDAYRGGPSGVDLSLDGTHASAPFHDATYSTTNANRGNRASTTVITPTGPSLTTYFKYDIFGNLEATWDPNLNKTAHDFTDAFTDGNTNHSDCATLGATYAFPTTITNAANQSSKMFYYSCSGLPWKAKDPNDVAANRDGTVHSYDPMHRPLCTATAGGGSTCAHYNTSSSPEQIIATKLATPDPSIVTTTTLDGLGRAITVVTGNVSVDTTYDGIGRVATRSNPHYGSSSATDGHTTFSYDALDRITSTTEPDGSVTSAKYSDNQTITTDETGRQRVSYFDAAARLIEVHEATDTHVTGQPAVFPSHATGSLTITATAAPGTGSVLITGGEQSTQVLNQAAQKATASFSISGQEGTVSISYVCGPNNTQCTRSQPDGGTITVDVNGAQGPIAQYNYPGAKGLTEQASDVAQGLAALLTGGSSPVTASANGSTVTVTATTAGTIGNTYTLSCSTTDSVEQWPPPPQPPPPSLSYGFPTCGSPFANGTDATYKTVYDAGTMTIWVNGHPDSYSWGSGDSAASIASGLIAAINNDTAASVTASPSSTGLNLTAKGSGAATNFTLSASTTFDTSHFGSASFAAAPSGANLAGGRDSTSSAPGESGTISVTISGHTTQYSWSGGPTTASIASGLSSAINNDSSSFVNASAANNVVTLTSRPTGSATNVAISVSSSSSQNSVTVSSSGSLSGAGDGDWSLSTPYATRYFYDPNNNLLCVEQHGNVAGSGCGSNPSQTASTDSTDPWRVRRFQYDQAGRLTHAYNPESGVTTYSYLTSASSLCAGSPSLPCVITDARGISQTLQYDTLNRLTSSSYSDGTPADSYSYDQATAWGSSLTNTIGRITTIGRSNNLAGSIFSYDVVGRLTSEADCRPSNCGSGTYGTSAQYNLAGALKQLTYPSGRIVSYTHNNPLGWLDTVVNASSPVVSHSTTLLTVNSFWPTGAWNSDSFGNGTQESSSYNSRLQPNERILYAPGGTSTRIADRQYVWTGCAQGLSSGNNGNVCGITDLVNAGHTQTFDYDVLNRITVGSQQDGSWSQTFTYDPWGNIQQSGTFNWLPLYDQGSVHNQVNSFGVQYDAAGDMTRDQNGNLYAFDAGHRITTINSTGVCYTYDAGGSRVRKDSGACGAGSVWTEYIDFNGLPIAEKNSDGSWSDYVYAEAKRFAQYTSGSQSPQYFWADQVNSTRVMTDAQGNKVWEGAFTPFGQQGSSTGAAPTRHLFDGKERDQQAGETGLDFFGARYYASVQGRWMSPDWAAAPTAVPYARFGNPQSLNLYSYVTNNPTTLADVDGHAEDPSGGYSGGLPDNQQHGSELLARLRGIKLSEFQLSRIPPYIYEGEQGGKNQPWWRKMLSWFYIKTSNGEGFGVSDLKVGLAKTDLEARHRGKEAKHTIDGKTVTTINSQIGGKVGIGPVKVGFERDDSQEEGKPPEVKWVKGFALDKFEGADAEL